jgi:hypothetical protein
MLTGFVSDNVATTGLVQYSPSDGRRLEKGEVTNNSSSAVTGDIYVTGYTNGTDPSGAVNRTLFVEWDLGGRYFESTMKPSFRVEIKEDPTFCDNVAIGQLQSDTNDSESDDGNHIILKNISHTEISQGESFINIEKPIEHLLNFPAVVIGHDGAVLACDILTEIIVQANEADATTPVGSSIAEDTSGASISIGLVVAFVGAVAASFMTI